MEQQLVPFLLALTNVRSLSIRHRAIHWQRSHFHSLQLVWRCILGNEATHAWYADSKVDGGILYLIIR
jgi:hypothetical protein